MGESISAAMARTNSCCVIARPRPRRLPSISRRYFNLSESFMSIADCDNNIAYCNILQVGGFQGGRGLESAREPEKVGALCFTRGKQRFSVAGKEFDLDHAL